ncbi:MAG TPA: tetratricopeptide repeat protein, partial [Capsulimonadaceae bacterium]|nr:tetratricopeptide repeat protein [Capsulimonadaceae bacterium]
LDQVGGEAALKHFRRALEIKPSLVEVHYHIGCALITLTQPEAALKEWELSAQAEPKYPDNHANLGIAYYRQGDINKAIASFRRVLALRQELMDDYSHLALAYARAKRFREAIEQFDKALELAPNNPMLHSNRGLACFQAADVEEATKEWRAVTRLDPEYAKRRAKKQQSEYDDSAVQYIPMYTTERALPCALHTAGLLFRFLPGYSAETWEVMVDDPHLAEVPAMRAEFARVERTLRALKL